jgi:hypothetical protein
MSVHLHHIYSARVEESLDQSAKMNRDFQVFNNEFGSSHDKI